MRPRTSPIVAILALIVALVAPVGPASADAFSARINFQPANAPVPAGYLADSGLPYADRGNGFAYGWNVDASAHVVDRNDPRSPDQRYDTLAHMSLYGDFSWQVAVPNGSYLVHVVSGDPQHYDSVDKIAAEGVLLLDGTPSDTSRWVEATQTVSVTDGQLTLTNAPGNYNNKIDYVDIDPAPFSVKVNFQPAGVPMVVGYAPDGGLPFGDRSNGYAYGWSSDLSAYAVDRDDLRSADQRYDTLVHMRDSFWEIALPNGTYTVHIVAGDPSYFDGSYRIAAEGAVVVDEIPSSDERWIEGWRTVTVVDGRLTLASAPNALNNKIDFVEVIPTTSTNHQPSDPGINEPFTDSQIVNPQDVHMESTGFSDPDPADVQRCSDWEIRTKAWPSQVVWRAACVTNGHPNHVHFGDGTFINSYAGRTSLLYDTEYWVRTRQRDSSGDAGTEWTNWVQRWLRTSSPPPAGGPVTWTLRQKGYAVEPFAGGLQLPVNIAFVPNLGTRSSDPFLYVTELYGNIKVVSRDGTVSDYSRGLLNYRPSGVFPGSGEQGLTGLLVNPATGDLFVSMLYVGDDGKLYGKVVRFQSSHNGTVAGSMQTILDLNTESETESHQISNLSIGPDGKLYVHVGDAFRPETAQNLDSFLGKILRVNLDGTPCTDNPFYDATDGITARDYIWTYGYRNPFGGAWRAADNQHYVVENGPSVDRFSKVVRGRNYQFDGTDASMRNYAIYNWNYAVAPVNLAFVQPETSGGSLFPLAKQGHAFVSESGPTYGTGPQWNGKRISEFVLDAGGNLVSGPTPLLEYTGTGRASVVGLASGPDGLYFTELYADGGTSPTDVGARIMRVRYLNSLPKLTITTPTDGAAYNAPGTVNIGATASDSDGAVRKVEFFNGSTKIGEDASAPYSFQWSGVAAGNYTLRVTATDDLGGTTTKGVYILVINPNDFGVFVSPATATVARGNAVSYTVTVTPGSAFTGTVNLSVNGLPSNTTASFTPPAVSISPATGPVTSTLTLSTTASSPVGKSSMTVYGTTGRLKHGWSMSLTIT